MTCPECGCTVGYDCTCEIEATITAGEFRVAAIFPGLGTAADCQAAVDELPWVAPSQVEEWIEKYGGRGLWG